MLSHLLAEPCGYFFTNLISSVKSSSVHKPPDTGGGTFDSMVLLWIGLIGCASKFGPSGTTNLFLFLTGLITTGSGSGSGVGGLFASSIFCLIVDLTKINAEGSEIIVYQINFGIWIGNVSNIEGFGIIISEGSSNFFFPVFFFFSWSCYKYIEVVH